MKRNQVFITKGEVAYTLGVTDRQVERHEQHETDLLRADVEATWTEYIMNARAKILALPTRTAHQVHAAAGAAYGSFLGTKDVGCRRVQDSARFWWK